MSSNKRKNADTIVMGSGKTYIAEYDASKGMPSVEEVCVPENELGKTKGGAALTYTTTQNKETDDLGTVAKTRINAEDAALKLGAITFNGNTLAKLVDRCKIVSEKDGKRVLHIGGAGNAQGKCWVVCFHHIDPEDGDIWVMIRGTNKAGLSLTYAVDAGTKIEPEFEALPQDDEGTLITYIEEIPADEDDGDAQSEE